MAQLRSIPNLLSVDEFLAGENDGTWRHEFVNGLVYAMAGASERHNIIRLNIAGLLNANAPDNCRVFDGDMKLQIQQGQDIRFFYPDGFVSCGDNSDAQYFRSDAILVIEVLSETTKRIDRYEKFEIYKRLPSLIEYVLIEQEFPSVEIYRRRHGWQCEVFGPSDSVLLESLNQSLAFEQIYRRVSFLTPPT